MKYIELKIKTESENIENALARLMGLGIFNVQIEDPNEIAGLIENLDDTEWYDEASISEDFRTRIQGEDMATITLYFDYTEEEMDRAKEVIGLFESESESDYDYDSDSDYDSLSAFKTELSIKDDSDWKDRWKEFYHPTRVSDRIIVAPTWAKDEDVNALATGIEEPIIIRLDPGMAFGTGTHETTALTLRMMEKYIPEFSREMPAEAGRLRIMDVGTGSGVLAIAASMLGDPEILAIDIDENAVKAAKENIEFNLGPQNVSDNGILVTLGDLTKGVDFTAHIILANLLSDLVIRFAPDAAKHLYPGGLFISSGILVEKEEVVKTAIENAGFQVIDILEDGDWCSITAKLL